MYVAELTFHGSRTQWDEEYARRSPRPRPIPDPDPFDTLFKGLDGALADASISLTFYEEALRNRLNIPSREERDVERARMMSRTAEIEEEMVRNAVTPKDFRAEMKLGQRVRADAMRAYQREKWNNGELPSFYAGRMPTLYARSFVFSMDQIGGFLASLFTKVKLARSWPWINADERFSLDRTLSRLDKCVSRFETAFPDLTGIRDSLAHFEDRIQLFGKDKVTRKPKTRVFDPPTTGIIFIEFGSHYQGGPFKMLLANGAHGSVDITPTSLQVAQECIQEAIDAFQWDRGSEHQSPY